MSRPLLGTSADAATHQGRRRNFMWAAINGALFEFGASFADTGTVVATFLGRLTPGTVAVGAATAIARFGWLLPQLFAARYAQGVEYRKSIYLVGGWGRALSLGVLGAVLLWWGGLGDAPGLALVFFFAIWTFFSFIAGLAGASYNDVIARTIPSEWRSRLLATRLFVGGALAVGGGLLIRSILQSSPEPMLRPYGLIFGAGAIVLAASTLCFTFIREPPASVAGRRSSLATFLREGIDVVRRDRAFRLFLYVQLLSGVTRMIVPFYIVQARVLGGLPELEVGTLLAAQAVGGIALNPLWGWWGDRRGKLSLLKALAVTSAISPLLAIVLPVLDLSPSGMLAGYALVFAFVGASVSGEIIGDLGYLMEISPNDRRPEYSGYMNALVAPSRLLPFVAGALLEILPFQVLFGVAAATALLGRFGVLRRLELLTTGSARIVRRGLDRS